MKTYVLLLSAAVTTACIWARAQASDQSQCPNNTNVVAPSGHVVCLSCRPVIKVQAPPRVPLTGRPLPNLNAVHLAAPAGKPALVCLFDASQRASRHALHLLDERADALRQQNLCVVAVQSPVTSDKVFNEWKTASPVSFPVGRVTKNTAKSKWALDTPESPWLILTDASHQVIAEGFSLDELDAQLLKMNEVRR